MHGVEYSFKVAKVEKLLQKVERQGKSDKILGYGVNVTADCDAGFLKALAAGKHPDYDDFFFEEDGALRPTYIGHFYVNRKLEGYKFEMEFDSVSEQKMILINVTIKNLVFIPLFGKQFKVKFTVQAEPSDEEILFLNHAVLKESLQVRIIAPPQIGLDLEQDDT